MTVKLTDLDVDALFHIVRDGGPQAEEAFTVMMTRLWHAMIRYAVAFFGRRTADADEAVADATLAVHQHRQVVQPGEPAEPWIFFRLKLACLDLKRKRKRDRLRPLGDHEPAAEADSPLERMERDEDLRRADQALEQFPDEERMIVTLRVELGWSVERIMEHLEIKSDRTFRDKFSRAMAKLKDAVGA